MSLTNRILVIVVAASGLLALVHWGRLIAQDVVARELERDGLVEQNHRLTEDIVRLEQEIAALKHRQDDPAWNALVDREVAKIARDELRMTKPGEIVFEIHGLEPQAAREGGTELP